MSNDKPFSIDENKPTDWFEPLYAGSNTDGEGVPWANMGIHPAFDGWLNDHPLNGNGKRALVVGCGMGDDAIELEKRGFAVTAFDVAYSAIKLCKERFPDSSVEFVVGDLLADNPDWKAAFDFVLEIYTVQALPPKYETVAIKNIAGFVAPSGSLLVVAEVEDRPRDFQNGPPWKLTPEHVQSFVDCGLELANQVINASELDEIRLGQYVTEFTKSAS